jgi:cystathionine beta-lyase
MSQFDFETVIERRGGDSIKWNKYAGRDVLPLWVADMDFAAPPAVIEALHRRVDQGCLGYGAPTPDVVDAVLADLDRRYGWRVAPESLVWLPGVVTALNVACRAVEGGVITATPVYPPFLSAPRLSGRELAQVPLRLAGGRWTWDFAAMEAAVHGGTKLLLLCHPHNPVGRAWDERELGELAAFCRRHALTVCSDEIHCGLVLDEERAHVPFALVEGERSELAERCITLMAASKTYNIPGLACAFAVIPNAELRRRFCATMRGIVPDANVLGFVATAAAYRDCEDWHRELLAVLRANRDRVAKTVAAIPQLSMTHVEATYLAWIDVRRLGVDNPQHFFETAGVGLSEGADFGLPGWLRLNFGCPPATLEAALERMMLACSAISP